MHDTYFELLIYTCNQQELVAHVTKNAEKAMAKVHDFGNGIWQQQLSDEIQRKLFPVRYNDLIGCIEVHTVGSQIRADYRFTDKSKIIVGSKAKGTIKPKGKLLEKHYASSQLSPPDIFQDFKDSLEKRINEHSRLKNRFVDFSAFDRCGPFIDWRKILGI